MLALHAVASSAHLRWPTLSRLRRAPRPVSPPDPPSHLAAAMRRYWTDFRARSILSDEMRAAKAASEWLYSVPWGLRKLLSWVKRR